MAADPHEPPVWRLTVRGSDPRYPPLDSAAYARLLVYGLRASVERGEGEHAVAWVPTELLGDLMAALDAAHYICWPWPERRAGGVTRLRVTMPAYSPPNP